MMYTQEDINNMKARGDIIITSQTFKKSATILQNRQIEYKGTLYAGHDWLLTYAHKEYQKLIKI